MGIFKTQFSLMAFGAIAVSLVMGIQPVAAESKIELVKSVGKVEIGTGPAGGWRPAGSGTPLNFGDVVRTGSQSSAELRFDSGIIRIFENTTLEIPAIPNGQAVSEEASKLSHVLLVKGRSLFEIFKDRLQGKFEVTSPSLIAGVKGTTFTVSEEENLKGVAVYEGTVVVTNRKNRQETITLTANRSTSLLNEHLTPAREIPKEEIQQDIQKEIKSETRDQNQRDAKSEARYQERMRDTKSQARHQERMRDLRQENLGLASGGSAPGLVTAPGLDGALPPGHGGTPPGLNGGLPPGHGGIPPGQMKK